MTDYRGQKSEGASYSNIAKRGHTAQGVVKKRLNIMRIF